MLVTYPFMAADLGWQRERYAYSLTLLWFSSPEVLVHEVFVMLDLCSCCGARCGAELCNRPCDLRLRSSGIMAVPVQARRRAHEKGLDRPTNQDRRRLLRGVCVE